MNLVETNAMKKNICIGLLLVNIMLNFFLISKLIDYNNLINKTTENSLSSFIFTLNIANEDLKQLLASKGPTDQSLYLSIYANQYTAFRTMRGFDKPFIYRHGISTDTRYEGLIAYDCATTMKILKSLMNGNQLSAQDIEQLRIVQYNLENLHKAFNDPVVREFKDTKRIQKIFNQLDSNLR